MSQNDPSAQMRQRLLMDIDELTRKPYPNIALHASDDLTKLCLVLSPPGWKEMHLTINNLERFPLSPPRISMDSRVSHPNVLGGYMCASILNDPAFYTPAYTLKGVAIQLLSFFCSDSIEQTGGYYSVHLEDFRMETLRLHETYSCSKCGYGEAKEEPQLPRHVPGAIYVSPMRRARRRVRHALGSISRRLGKRELAERPCHINRLPNEVLLMIIDKLDDFEHLTNLARAWSRISRLVTDFDVVRQRELQCFFSKESYRHVKLGVGVSTIRCLASEFDLLSKDAFDVGVSQSVQNIPFSRWLALPISHGHWARVGNDARETLIALKTYVKLDSPSMAQVLYTFMNDIVVKLNQVTQEAYVHCRDDWHSGLREHTSTLRHASEKAIESYFHLFHLLVCLATEDGAIVDQANNLIASFMAGRRSKAACPNLGHLLVALLISDIEITDALRRNIITEAITRNVVWLLDPTGANHPELSYLESEPVSAYRLDTTFQGSLTSYRLLMFSELFRRTARPSKKTSLGEIRDELFRRHGGPPPGAATRLAAEARRLHQVGDFPAFLREMGIQKKPNPQEFTALLRRTMRDSVSKGYSCWAMTQLEAYFCRQAVEPKVGISREIAEYVDRPRPSTMRRINISFFPAREGGKRDGRGRTRGRGGRDSGGVSGG